MMVNGVFDRFPKLKIIIGQCVRPLACVLWRAWPSLAHVLTLFTAWENTFLSVRSASSQV
jgi:predicted TIM-barrel fold metal-dependent hydrolase